MYSSWNVFLQLFRCFVQAVRLSELGARVAVEKVAVATAAGWVKPFKSLPCQVMMGGKRRINDEQTRNMCFINKTPYGQCTYVIILWYLLCRNSLSMHMHFIKISLHVYVLHRKTLLSTSNTLLCSVQLHKDRDSARQQRTFRCQYEG